MKKRAIFVLAITVLFVVAPWASESAFGGVIEPNQYYTWGISDDDLTIPEGSIITEAVLTIHNITNYDANDVLYIHLLDNPPLGFVANEDTGYGDYFEGRGILLTPGYNEPNLTCTFSNLNDPCSWVWERFDFPLVFGPNDSLVIDSSLVLELIDYAGTGTSFGFGFDPNGSSYNFEEITLELTIESFESEVEQYTVTFASTGDASLVGHWTMDDDAANATVEDSSGNGNNGTAQQNTSVLHTAGQIGGALTFNGITDYVDCGNDNSFDITDEITISAWVKFDSLPNYQSILVKRGTQTDTASNYALRTSALANRDEVEFYYHDGSSWHVYTTSNANLTAGQWYHFVVTFTFGTGTSAKCYVNNNLLSGSWTLGNGNSPVQINTKPVTIGGLTSEERADGVIDQVKIFNKALSAAEVLELYNEPPLQSRICFHPHLILRPLLRIRLRLAIRQSA